MDFGLGLILNFTDNATSGIEKASKSLMGLTSMAQQSSDAIGQIAQQNALGILAQTADRVGNTFVSMGSKVLSSISGIINKINETGSTVMYARNAFTTLFGGGEEGIKQADALMTKIQTYAAKSTFAFEDLIPVVQMLKANGIDAFETITSTSGKSAQLLMDYASDLAAFNPQMRNAYGKGIQAAMGALNEYIAEGNKKSLKSGASIDITEILGEAAGKTIEERSRQVADLMEKLNMVGQTKAMQGTPMQIMSNLGDQLFIFMNRVSDLGGVFDEFTTIVSKIGDFVEGLVSDTDTFNAVAKAVGEGLVAIMKPIEKIVDRLTKVGTALFKILKQRPQLAKMITLASALSGVILVASGFAIKALGTFATLTNAIITLSSHFGTLSIALSTGVRTMLSTIAPLALAIGAIAVAWNTDFGGIRTNVTGFVTNVIDSFNRAREIVGMDSDSMMQNINSLANVGDFWSNITIGFAKLLVVGQALQELWGSEDGYTLSAETFQKLDSLGLLPLIEHILDLKYRFGEFKKGFIAGFEEISTVVRQKVDEIKQSFAGTFISDALDGISDFLGLLSNNDAQTWQDFGNSLGKVVTVVSSVAFAFRIATPFVKLFISVIKGIVGIFSKIISFGGSIVGVVGKIKTAFSGIHSVVDGFVASITGSNGTGIIANLAPVFETVKESIVGFISGLSAPVLAVIAVVVGSIVSYVVTRTEDFREKVGSLISNFVEGLKNIWNSLVSSVKMVWDTVVNTAQPVIEAFGNLKQKLFDLFSALGESDVVQSLISLLADIGELIFDVIVPAVNAIWNIISTVASEVLNIVGTVVSSIISVIGGVITTVADIISGIFQIITGIFTLNGGMILEGVGTILSSLLNLITNILTNVSNIFMSVLQGVLNIVSSIFTGIANTVSGLLRGLVTVIGGILETVITVITTPFRNASDKVQEIVNNLKDKLASIIDRIKSIFNITLPTPKLKLPHLSITGKLSIDPPSVPKIGVEWYEKGGVFNRASVIGVGENGAEAVMPLENNTGWITTLADKINTASSSPVTSNNNSSITNNAGATYLTKNYSSTDSGNYSRTYTDRTVDNSIKFESGSIVVQVMSATEEEAERFANIVMEKISRKSQLDRLTNYQSPNPSDLELA